MEKRKDLLVWIDLETTGLDEDNGMQGVHNHKILEIGVHITDSDLNIVDKGLQIAIKNDKETIEKLMVPFVKDMHTKNNLLVDVEKSTISLESAEKMVLEYLNGFNIQEKSSPICGNNVGFDRNFINAQMPKLGSFLHYRKLDVSSFKELFNRQYLDAASLVNKKAGHRALDDIKESIEELKTYKTHFMVPSNVVSADVVKKNKM